MYILAQNILSMQMTPMHGRANKRRSSFGLSVRQPLRHTIATSPGGGASSDPLSIKQINPEPAESINSAISYSWKTSGIIISHETRSAPMAM